MKKTNKKIILTAMLSALGVGAAAAASYAVTDLLVRTALDRKQPKIMKGSGNIISGGERDSKFVKAYTAAAEKLRATEHELVTITSHDGIKLIGHFFPNENAKRVVIAFHGWRSCWYQDYGMVSEFWSRNNCSVLYVEQRGQNNSGGEYMGFGLTERYDCVDWSNWAVCRCGRQLPIYLAGLSMGASTVLMAADLDLPDNVCGIMADCGFTSPKAIWKHVAGKNLHIAYGPHSHMADIMCKKRINMGAGDFSTVDALSKTKIPVLLIHGTDDHFVPIEMTYENYKACNSPKRLLVVPGADHSMSYFINKDEYEYTELKFMRDFDKFKTV